MRKSPAYIRVSDQIKVELLSDTKARSGLKLPTQEELSERFGVSRSTIIRSLSKLAAEGYLTMQQGSGGYIAHPSKQEAFSQSICLIVPVLHASVIVSACRGVERRARELGYKVMLASSEFGLAHEQELVEQYSAEGTAGIILYPVTRKKTELVDDYLLTRSDNIPLVTMDIACEEWPCSRVQFDNFRLCSDMTHRIIKHGRKNILFMPPFPDLLHSSIDDRQKGWESATKEAQLLIPESYVKLRASMRTFSDAENSIDYASFAQAVQSLSPIPDAVIAWNDITAAYLIQALINIGVRVPEDMLVTGFDAEPTISKLFRPQFPTTKPDFLRLGEMAVDVLHRMKSDATTAQRIYYYPVSVQWRDPRPENISVALNKSQSDAVETSA